MLVLLSACGSDDGDPSGSRPTSCDPDSARVGAYMLRYAEQSGTCGPIDDSLVRLGPTAPPNEQCEYLSPGTYSEGHCKVEQSFVCTFPELDQEWTSTGTSTQATEDGSRLEGTLDVTIRSVATGEVLCHSIYSLTYTRQ